MTQKKEIKGAITLTEGNLLKALKAIKRYSGKEGYVILVPRDKTKENNKIIDL